MNTKQQYIKKSIVVICLLFVSITYAQQGINYQGVARNAANELLIDTDITLDLNIVKTSTDGETTYSETHTTNTDANGVFSVVIGNGIPTLNLFEDINWAEDKHFLKVSLNGTEVGTTAFTSVPYVQAMGKWQAHKNGVTPKGTGMSIYIGDNAGENDDFTDNHNIGIGKDALQRTNNGYDNVAIGEEAMKLVTNGHGNTAIGKQALFNTSSGYDNIAIGNETLYNNTNGEANIALGNGALRANTTGKINVALGFGALTSNTIGESNIAIGSSTLSDNTIGFNNIAQGFNSLKSNTIGNGNTAIGFSSQESNTSGSSNISLGTFSLNSNTTGNSNIAQGYKSLFNNTTGSNNIAMGEFTLFNNTTGENNIATSFEALYENTTGNANHAIGYQALRNNTTGGVNLALGFHALRHNTEGGVNLALGPEALLSNITGSDNMGIGANAGRNNVSGNYNTFVGIRSGNFTTGSSNVFLGYYAGYNETGSNKLYIENTASASPLIYGEFDNEVLGFNAKVGIGTKTPSVPLQITTGNDATLTNGTGQLLLGNELDTNLVLDNNEIQARNNGVTSTLSLQPHGGNINIGGAVSVQGSVVHDSDRRLKRDITDISYGLKDVLKLRPTEYFWKGKTQNHKSLGLIAQEVDEVIKNVVTYNKEQDKYGVSYTELIPVLIKAIQEQEKIINSQGSALQSLQGEVSELKASINNLSN